MNDDKKDISLSEQILNDIKILDNINNKTSDMRNKLINNLYKQIKDIKIDFKNDSPKKIEAKTSTLNTLISMLNDYEDSFRRNIKIKQRTKVIENDEKVVDDIITMFQYLSENNKDDNFIPIDKQIEDTDKKIDKLDIKISENELSKNPKLDIKAILEDDVK